MENLNINKPLNQPAPINKDIDKLIPFDDSGPGESGVSHAPLDLGGSSPVQIPKVEMPKPAVKKMTEKTASTDRIVGVRTFFTKLHPGALNFLDEQITKWLAENPGIKVKRTNITTGELQAKKTEPNIIITVWY
ncbi:MAG: hypothetical protein A2Z38_07180 [Planctomycetes bacterium RBG_19FT_COMBO_48_8]|nr:MAG: hypothetical protein A2Z38_07180 [Planctomycetes bacterium RBG_19FT_COMBO_48_8]